MSPSLWIVPSWHEAPDPDAIVLVLDPGHGLRYRLASDDAAVHGWLERTVKGGKSILDYGCGSGILAIAAAKLGAGEVHGVDIDLQAVECCQRQRRAQLS